MKGKTHFAYGRKQVRKQIALRLKAEAEASKLRAQLKEMSDMIERQTTAILKTLHAPFNKQ